MKKLAIAQIVLGILVVGSLVFWMGWVEPGYHDAFGVDPDGNIRIRILGLVAPNPLVDAWAVIYLVLGLSVLGCGIAQYLNAGHQTVGIGRQTWGIRFAITQIVLGVVIVGSLAWFIGWVEWDYGSYTRLIEDVEVVIHPLPGWIVRLISWKAVSFVLGLSVLGCDITQFLKAKGLKGA